MPIDPDSRLGRSVQKMAASPAFAKVGPSVMPPLDRFVHRVSGGRFMVSRMMLPVVALTTTGRRSGQPRESPLATVPHDGELYVVGSNFGRPHHPAWSWNLLAEPRAKVSYRGEEFEVRAELLDAGEKAAIWPELIAEWPLFDLYVERSGRDLRVFRLRRV
jgi:deazaflavin-dependent oxidoreductase (nitroreductase family)